MMTYTSEMRFMHVPQSGKESQIPRNILRNICHNNTISAINLVLSVEDEKVMHKYFFLSHILRIVAPSLILILAYTS